MNMYYYDIPYLNSKPLESEPLPYRKYLLSHCMLGGLEESASFWKRSFKTLKSLMTTLRALGPKLMLKTLP